MNTIPIYRAEVDIADVILQNNTIAYASLLKKSEQFARASASQQDITKSFGNIQDKDLYYTESILVTTNWNLNDDVFSAGEAWKARHTPLHKPTNLNHDEHVLVGHITNNWAIVDGGGLISDDSVYDDLPDVFHLLTGAVIYLNWEDEALVERTQKLIAEIEAGTKYVSMECLFSDFDYAVITPEQKYHVISRDKTTAWLTKKLRAYGGDGIHEGYKIGRLLKNIVFCGKGYVDNPANPNSIIINNNNLFQFNKSSAENPFFENSGVLIKLEDSNSSQQKSKVNAEMDIEQLKAQITSLTEQLAAANTQVADMAKLQEQIADSTSQVEAAKKAMDDEKKEKDNMKTKCEELTAKLAEVEAAKAELDKQISDIKAEQIVASRVALLVGCGFAGDAAKAKVELFSNLTDEQFKVLAEELATAKKTSAETEVDVNVNNAETEVLETAKVEEEVSLAATEEKTDELADVREQLKQAFASLGKSNKARKSQE